MMVEKILAAIRQKTDICIFVIITDKIPEPCYNKTKRGEYMRLRSIMKHVRDQNWFAIFLDFFIVVVGVFIGLAELLKQIEDELGTSLNENTTETTP
ncbi:MAG: hypothetical protein COA69_04840 [Robiginitomaculum sp.]|nr:MAG: hypothetical protein COA69_04840 [Robiginitomaculum sp.]